MATQFIPPNRAKGRPMITGLTVLGSSFMLLLLAVWWVFRH
jgi:hypothetical protein